MTRMLSNTGSLKMLLICFTMLIASWPWQPAAVQASGSTMPAPATAITDITLNTTTPAQYDKLEIKFQLGAAYDNPFDPDEVDARAFITTPSGQVDIVPAFYAANASPQWAVRYSPRQLGRNDIVIKVTDQAGISESGTYSFTAGPAGAGRGFMGVAGNRFIDSYGKQLTLFGTNYAWGTPEEMLAAMPEYKDARMNLMRVWLSCWWGNYAPEYGPTSTTQNGITMTYDGIGRYNLDNMSRMDALIDTARDNQLYIMLTLNSFGDFYYDWAYHAYSRDNGGPSGWKENDTDFWYNPEAVKFQERLLRYIFARWGYSTSFGMLEYWNESDNRVDTSADIRDSWHAELDRYWKSLDFYKHPTTTSFAWKDHAEQHATQLSWEGLDSLDAVNIHLYSADSDIIGLWESNLNALKPYGDRPIFVGEGGKTGNDGSTEAQLYNYIHDGVWAPIFRSGAAGANLWWVFENGFNMPEKYKAQYTHLASFLQPEEPYLIHMPFIDYGLQSNGTKVGGYQGADRALLWINDNQATYDNAAPRQVNGMTFSIPDLKHGSYTVTYYDTYTGDTIAEVHAAANANGLRLALPSFTRDIAVKAVRRGAEPPVNGKRPTPVPVDKQAPSTPMHAVAVSQTDDTIILAWQGSTDNAGVTSYEVYRDGKLAGSANNLAPKFKDTMLEPGRTYEYQVVALDASGNRSKASANLQAATQTRDVAAPPAPANLAAAASGIGSVDLAWEAATDDRGVARYLIYRDGLLVGTTQDTVYQDQGLRPGTAYQYAVTAEDAAWNVSGYSGAVSATTDSPDLSDNLLLNPGFESVTGDMPDQWVCEQSQYCQADLTDARTGGHALLLAGDTGAWFGVQSAAVPAIAGNTYMLDSYVKIPVNNGTTVKIRLQFLNAVDSILDDKQIKSYSGITPGGEYDNVYGTVVAPEHTAKVRIYAYVEGLHATVLLDDFSLRTYGSGTVDPSDPGQSSSNLLLNPGFDEHNDAWKTAIWTCEKDWLCQWTDQVKRSGGASMRVLTSNPDWFSIYQDAVAEAGKTYRLDGYANLAVHDGGMLQAKLVFYDAGGNSLSEDWIQDIDAVTDGFVNIHGEKQAPDSTAKVRVLIYANGFAGDAYLDDFSLTAVTQ